MQQVPAAQNMHKQYLWVEPTLWPWHGNLDSSNVICDHAPAYQNMAAKGAGCCSEDKVGKQFGGYKPSQ